MPGMPSISSVKKRIGNSYPSGISINKMHLVLKKVRISILSRKDRYDIPGISPITGFKDLGSVDITPCWVSQNQIDSPPGESISRQEDPPSVVVRTPDWLIAHPVVSSANDTSRRCQALGLAFSQRSADAEKATKTPAAMQAVPSPRIFARFCSITSTSSAAPRVSPRW